MPLEIRELIIRAQIEAPPPPHGAVEAVRAAEELREAIVREVIERVEEMLAGKGRR